jgi:hypothetical protein
MQLAKALCTQANAHATDDNFLSLKMQGGKKKKKEDSSTHSLAHLAQVASIKADGDGRTDGQPASQPAKGW